MGLPSVSSRTVPVMQPDFGRAKHGKKLGSPDRLTNGSGGIPAELAGLARGEDGGAPFFRGGFPLREVLREVENKLRSLFSAERVVQIS